MSTSCILTGFMVLFIGIDGTESHPKAAEIVSRPEPRDLPLLPSQQTMHLMAKAAVAIYESAFRIRQGITVNETRKEEPDDAHDRQDDLADL